jgi:hypothetical protein
MQDRKQEMRRGSAISWLLLGCFISTLALPAGCHSGKNGGTTKANLSMSSYAEVRHRANPDSGKSMYYFPTLEIYNRTGSLFYESHNAIENAKLLKDFPASVQRLQPQPDAPRLQAIVNEIPELKAGWEAAEGRDKWTILSIGLEDCKGCSIQESALAELEQSQPTRQSAVVLEISIMHP